MVKTLPLSFRLPPELKSKLVATAEANKMSVSEYLINIIASALDMNQYVNTSVQAVNVDKLKEELETDTKALLTEWREQLTQDIQMSLEGIYERLEKLEANGAGINPTTPTYSPGDQINTNQYHKYLQSLGHRISRETVTKLWSEADEKYLYVRESAHPIKRDGKKLWELV